MTYNRWNALADELVEAEKPSSPPAAVAEAPVVGGSRRRSRMTVTVVTIEGVSICPAADITLIDLIEERSSDMHIGERSSDMQPWRVRGEFIAKTDLSLVGKDVVITLITDDPRPSRFMSCITHADWRSNNNLTRFSFVGRWVS